MTGTRRFPTRRVRLFLLGYGLLWAVALPLVLAYLWWRGRRDRLYAQHPGERFGVWRAALCRPADPGALGPGRPRRHHAFHPGGPARGDGGFRR